MRGIHFAGDRKIEMLEVPDPTPGPGEVVLEIKGSGMCGSDLKFYRATKAGGAPKLGLKMSDKPVIAGHEPCGVVAAVGADVSPRQARVGARVMVHHYSGCGFCPQCKVGWSQLCEVEPTIVYGVSGHGAHAPYMKVPASTIVPLPDGLSFEAGAAISCGTGTAYSALRRMNVSGRHTVVVIGQGPVGLAGTQLAAAMGARVIALDINNQRLSRAAEFGADLTINPNEINPVDAVKQATHGLGADCVLDAAGGEKARLLAANCTRTWGTVCLVGEGGDLVLDVSVDILRRQLTIIGSWTFSSLIQGECAQFILDHGLSIDHQFTHRWKLNQAVEAYTLWDKQTEGKGIFLM